MSAQERLARLSRRCRVQPQQLSPAAGGSGKPTLSLWYFLGQVILPVELVARIFVCILLHALKMCVPLRSLFSFPNIVLLSLDAGLEKNELINRFLNAFI